MSGMNWYEFTIASFVLGPLEILVILLCLRAIAEYPKDVEMYAVLLITTLLWFGSLSAIAALPGHMFQEGETNSLKLLLFGVTVIAGWVGWLMVVDLGMSAVIFIIRGKNSLVPIKSEGDC